MANVNPEIEIGINALARNLNRGETLTSAEIADVCGCTPQSIAHIEKTALKKLHNIARRLNLHDYLVDVA